MLSMHSPHRGRRGEESRGEESRGKKHITHLDSTFNHNINIRS
jgi:hypothetical protein